MYYNGSSECMEVIGDIGECQGGCLSRGRFASVKTLYGSLIVCKMLEILDRDLWICQVYFVLYMFLDVKDMSY